MSKELLKTLYTLLMIFFIIFIYPNVRTRKERRVEHLRKKPKPDLSKKTPVYHQQNRNLNHPNNKSTNQKEKKKTQTQKVLNKITMQHFPKMNISAWYLKNTSRQKKQNNE